MWYQRNIRIYHNINALVSSPRDRILVIVGTTRRGTPCAHFGRILRIAAASTFLGGGGTDGHDSSEDRRSPHD